MRRYALDTLARLKEFAHVRSRRSVEVLHGDAREIELRGSFDAVVTSPPYPGLIDYHEQHRYAYELLGLDDLRAHEIGAGARGTSRAAIDAYVDGISGVLGACAEALKRRGRVVIVVNDRRGLYPEILERAGLVLEQRYQRHVNRRTGRRAGEYFEDVLVARRALDLLGAEAEEERWVTLAGLDEGGDREPAVERRVQERRQRDVVDADVRADTRFRRVAGDKLPAGFPVARVHERPAVLQLLDARCGEAGVAHRRRRSGRRASTRGAPREMRRRDRRSRCG